MYFSQLSKAIGPRLVLSNPLSATPPHFSSLYVSTFRWPAKNSYYELEVATNHTNQRPIVRHAGIFSASVESAEHRLTLGNPKP